MNRNKTHAPNRRIESWPYVGSTAWFLTGLTALTLGAGCHDSTPTPRPVVERVAATNATTQQPTSSVSVDTRFKAIPLAQPSVKAGRTDGNATTLFESLGADVTGIDFVNHLKPENNVPYIYMGAGVAAGDYDGDGKVDLYLASVDSPNRLYRQVESFRFEDVTDKVGGVDGGDAWSRGATFFDVDNDGDLDLYVCNTEAPNCFYLNLGDGTFRECAAERGLAFVGASVMIGVADYDQDGDLDLYLLTHRSLHHSVRGAQLAELSVPSATQKSREQLEFSNEFGNVNGRRVPRHPVDWYERHGHWEIAGQADALLRNDGTGHFDNVTRESGIGTDPGLGLSCTWLDFDLDGLLDLHVANDLQSSDRLYHNNGDGTFREMLAEVLPYTTWFSMGSDFGDINNDGRFDHLVVDMASTTHYRAKVQMGDMSRFRYFMEQESPAQLMRNCLFLNTGTKRYLEVAPMVGLDATDWTWSARLNDLDNDGWVDAFFTNGIARADEMNPDMRAERERIRVVEGADALIKMIRQQPQDNTQNLAFRNTGKLQFEDVSHAWGVADQAISYAAAQVDLDGDGDLDLVVGNHNKPVSVYRNNEAQSGRLVVRLQGRRSNRFGIGAKLTLRTAKHTQVRQLFPVRGYMTCDEASVHFGVGQETVQSLTIDWPSGHQQILPSVPVNHQIVVTEPMGEPDTTQAASSGDLSSDFVESAAEAGVVFRHQEYDYDDYELQPLLPAKLSQLGPGVAFGDANGDGHEDLFVGGAAGQSGRLFTNDGTGRFDVIEGPWSEQSDYEDMAILWLDVDGDDDQDLVIASGSSEYDPGDPRLADRLYLNQGDARFVRAPDEVLPYEPGHTSSVTAADFDHDGDLDLFVGERAVPGEYPTVPRSYLLLNENGRYRDVTMEVAPDLVNVGLVTSAVWSDVNRDGFADLWVATEWGPVHLFVNQAGTLTEATDSAGLGGRLGWWSSLACGDGQRRWRHGLCRA